MRISTTSHAPIEALSDTSDRDRLSSQVSAIASLEVGNENITASGSFLMGSRMPPALVAYTEEQIRLSEDTHRLRGELRAL
jgi:hypothetical protein